MGFLKGESTQPENPQPENPQPEYDDHTIQSSATALVTFLSHTQKYLSLDEMLGNLYDTDTGAATGADTGADTGAATGAATVNACAKLIQLGKGVIPSLRRRALASEATGGAAAVGAAAVGAAAEAEVSISQPEQ